MDPSGLVARRRFLQLGAAAAGTWLAAAPGLVLARAQTQRRFVFILQRGAADGLDTIIPYADPGYARLRGALAIDAAAATRLDGTFALHPALQQTAALYAAGQALFVHAVASPYRDRSHFDGQNVLESGGSAPFEVKDGWLNRLIVLLDRSVNAVAINTTIPLALRGAASVDSHAPSAPGGASDDLLQRFQQLYAQDAQLNAMWSAAMSSRGMSPAAPRRGSAELGALAARFLAQPDGPRIAMLETAGWDTHSAQAPRLANQLKALDAMVAALKSGLGDAWSQTTRADCHRVRPHCRSQRHGRDGPWNRRRRHGPGRRGGRRPCAGRLAGPGQAAPCTKAGTCGPRPACRR